MKSTKYILSILVLIIGLGVQAQNSGLQWDGLNASSNRLEGKLKGKIYYISPLANRNFLFPKDWVDGEIVLADGVKYENMKLRYLASSDELIAYNERTFKLHYVDKEQIRSFLLIDDEINRHFELIYSKEGNKKGRFYEVLFQGKQSLLARRYIYEQKVMPYVDKMGTMRDVEYELHAEYFRYLPDGSFHKISINRRSVVHAFPEHKKQVKKLIRNYSISLSSEASMVFLFNHLEKENIL